MSKPNLTFRGDSRKLKRLASKSQAAALALKNLAPAMKRASVFLDRWVQDNFKTEGGNVGGWEPFAYDGRPTGRQVEGVPVVDTTAKLLQDTGRLRASFMPWATKNNAGIGSDLPYAEFHNDGAGVPERRILPERGEIDKEVYDILNEYINDSALKDIEEAFR